MPIDCLLIGFLKDYHIKKRINNTANKATTDHPPNERVVAKQFWRLSFTARSSQRGGSILTEIFFSKNYKLGNIVSSISFK